MTYDNTVRDFLSRTDHAYAAAERAAAAAAGGGANAAASVAYPIEWDDDHHRESRLANL